MTERGVALECPDLGCRGRVVGVLCWEDNSLSKLTNLPLRMRLRSFLEGADDQLIKGEPPGTVQWRSETLAWRLLCLRDRVWERKQERDRQGRRSVHVRQ